MAGVRLRFAPSPSGALHVGGARTALFNWLYARRHGGRFILRVEDTDEKRSSLESVQAILDSMRWLGLDWDEGPDIGGPAGPYFQSERLPLYQEAARRLTASGHTYECTCTEQELEARRKEQQERGEPLRYEGTCLARSDADKARRRAEGVRPALRFKVPKETIAVPDVVKGPVAFDAALYGDLVIVRGNGQPMYNFACVVDDHHMGITHVVRGDEHLPNTPKQMLLHEALGHPMPVFAHLPMILGKDREKLSKRHGHTAVGEYRLRGYLPDAMVNYLALLGWSAPDGQEVFGRSELVERFDLERVVRNPAVFDGTKLDWLDHEHIKRLSLEDLAARIAPYLDQVHGRHHPDGAAGDPAVLLEIVRLVRDTLFVLSDAPRQMRVFFEPPVLDEASVAALQAVPRARDLVLALAGEIERLAEPTRGNCKEALVRAGQAVGIKGKDLYHTARVAATGQAQGHDLVSVLWLLGQKRAVANLRACAERIL